MRRQRQTLSAAVAISTAGSAYSCQVTAGFAMGFSEHPTATKRDRTRQSLDVAPEDIGFVAMEVAAEN